MALSREADIIFKTIYAVLILTNFVGNTLVCLIVRRFSFMKTRLNFLLVHLAVCDMLTGFIFLLRSVLNDFIQVPGRAFGDFYCPFLSFVWCTSVSGTYTLVAVSLERYNAITKPFAPRMSNKKLKIAVAMSWLFGFIVWIPSGVTNVYSEKTKGCDSSWEVSWGPVFDCFLWLILVAIVPTVTVTVLYGRVVFLLWVKKNNVNDVAQRSLIKSRKKITKTAIILTVVLVICWTPNLIYFVVVTFVSEDSTNPNKDLKKVSPIFYPTSLALIVFNSSANPFIYALQDTRFRECMKNILCGRSGTDVFDEDVAQRNRQQRNSGANRIETREEQNEYHMESQPEHEQP